MIRYAMVVVLFLGSCAVVSFAADKVVVVPLNTSKSLSNIVTVSTRGGDFSDPVSAVNSINNASENNRYLVVIGPGRFVLTHPLIMKSYVDVRGSGKNTTLLTGAISSNLLNSTSALVVGAKNTALSDLSITNKGGGSYSVGIFNTDVNRNEISNVDVSVWGAEKCHVPGACGNYGMYNTNFSSPAITNSQFQTSGTYAFGIYNDGAHPQLNNVKLLAWVDEGSGCCGAYGISSTNSSSPYIRYSHLYGASYGLQQGSGNVHVSHSTIENQIDTGGGAVLTCVYNDNGFGVILDGTCHEL